MMGWQPESVTLPSVELQPNQVASLLPASGLSRKTLQGWDGDFTLVDVAPQNAAV